MSQLGVVGLGTMGANLARNAVSRGAHVAVYNRTQERTAEFMNLHRREGDFTACQTLKEMTQALQAPRPILLMVKAGPAVDAVIGELLPLLSKGDILIDAGNSLFTDTARREAQLKEKGIRFVGMGVSGGEEGALKGPSMMPGGDKSIVKDILPLLKKMAASDGSGGSCVTYIGPQGAGHFVKMVHNGIEYAIMQLIAEAYDLLKTAGKLKNKQLAEIFSTWAASDRLGSFLMEITARIFMTKDPLTGKDLIDVIADAAGQKGTGKWTTETAMTVGVAIPSINSAVDARILSGATQMRKAGKELPSKILKTPPESTKKWINDVASALELSIFYAYVQGFALMETMSVEQNWNLDLSEIARIWCGGCIIRSKTLQTLQKIYAGSKSAKAAVLKKLAGPAQMQWRFVLSAGVMRGIPLAAMGASLSYYDSFSGKKLPTNLIQAQRDFFGAHTYQRIDKSGIFHTNWSGNSF